MVRTTVAPAPLDPAFAMAGSDPVDGGSHLAQIACRADGCRRIDICWPKPAAASRHRTLSDLMCAGGPRAMNRSASAASTSSWRSWRATISARHSLLASSMMVRMRNLRPSCVRASTKSYAQTCPGYSGRSRIHEPSFNHRRPRFGCRWGTFSPSRRQIRSTRLSSNRSSRLPRCS